MFVAAEIGEALAARAAKVSRELQTRVANATPRVLWVGVAAGREELLLAEREISCRLVALGIPEEERAYSPHLTLARVREPAGLRSARLLEGLTDKRLGTVRIDAITLFHSTLSPKGPTYTSLLRIPCES